MNKKNIFTLLSFFFFNNVFAQCINQGDFNYEYKINKNEINLTIEKKDKTDFIFFQKEKTTNIMDSIVFFLSLKKNEVTMDRNIVPINGIDWYYRLYDFEQFYNFPILNRLDFIKTTKIKQSFKLNDLIEKTLDNTEYPNEKRNLNIYTVLFIDHNLNCVYFKSPDIVFNFRELNQKNDKKNKFKP